MQADFVTLRAGASLTLTYTSGVVSVTPTISPVGAAVSVTRSRTTSVVRARPGTLLAYQLPHAVLSGRGGGGEPPTPAADYRSTPAPFR